MDNDFILVLNLGGQGAIDMARKLRNQRYYTEIMSRSADIALFRRKAPRGILVVGDAVDGDAAGFPPAALEMGIPVLALGAAARLMAAACGAVSEGVLLSNQATQIRFQPCPLFDQLTESDRYFDRVDGFTLPQGFTPIAETIEGCCAAFADFDRQLFGLQFYAESNDPDGAIILSNFAEKICGCTPIWTVSDYVDEETRYIRDRIGMGSALMAVSGGVDSATCAMLMRRAIGDHMKCVFIDNGLLRDGEAEFVRNTFEKELGFQLIQVDAQSRFLECLKSVSDPVEKHRAVYGEYVAILEELRQQNPDVEYVVQGTIYSDLLIGGSSDAVYARGLDSGKLLEPIRMLFKDEVRAVGELLGLPAAIIERQSFPGPALAVRCMGAVTAEKLELLRRADAIFSEEVKLAGQDKRLSQYFVVLGKARTLGRRNNAYTYEYACVLRAVTTKGATAFAVGRLPYDLLDRTASRIISEVPGINRVTYDITPDDFAAIEWQ